MKLVVLGLSTVVIVGQWTCDDLPRARLRLFAKRGHDILFLERDVPWYPE